ncbi:MAG: acylphosphatase [Reyranellaceae bacterium]
MVLQARLSITGRVQGVGYRDWLVGRARQLSLDGWVRNRVDGSVEAVIVGEESAIGRMIDACRHGPPLARVEAVDVEPLDLDVLPQGFTRLPTA